MDFVEIKSNASIQIQAFEPGLITISNKQYSENLIITPDQIIENSLPTEFAELSIAHLKQLLSLRPEVVVIGTGLKQKFPITTIRDWFVAHQVGVEFMDTAAACRTFQILTSEKRQVVALLFID